MRRRSLGARADTGVGATTGIQGQFQALTRPLVDRLVPTTDGRGLSYDDAITAALTGMRRGDTLLALRDHPSEEPSPAAVWHWHLTCSTGDVEIDVIASQDLETFMLEDDNGRFEIEADAAEFSGVLTRRLLG